MAKRMSAEEWKQWVDGTHLLLHRIGLYGSVVDEMMNPLVEHIAEIESERVEAQGMTRRARQESDKYRDAFYAILRVRSGRTAEIRLIIREALGVENYPRT